MTDIIIAFLLLLGAVFCLTAAVGLVRLPDVYVRMHAGTKAGTLGGGFILIAVAIVSGELEVIARVLAAIAFLILTAPIGAHLLGRAAYATGVPLWKGTKVDQLKGRYDPETGILAGLDSSERQASHD